MPAKVLVIKENPARLLGTYFPDIQVDDRSRYDQEEVFDVMYKYKVIGRARLTYRIPFQAKSLRESQTYMVYNKPVGYVNTRFQLELGADFKPESMLVYLLFQWVERDLVAFEQIFKEQWDAVVMENPAQHQMQLAI
jgi:hypothetical protein